MLERCTLIQASLEPQFSQQSIETSMALSNIVALCLPDRPTNIMTHMIGALGIGHARDACDRGHLSLS